MNESWVAIDVEEHPAAHPADLGDLGAPEVEPGTPAEPDPRASTGIIAGRLQHDAERGADGQQLDLVRRDGLAGVRSGPRGHQRDADDR